MSEIERFSDRAIEFINELHRERLDYESEYLPLIEAANRLAELENKIESSQLVELPCVAMIEQGLVDGKFKPTNEAQHFNGRYAVVYFDKTKLKKPLIDICWGKQCTYDPYQAQARLKELKGE